MSKDVEFRLDKVNYDKEANKNFTQGGCEKKKQNKLRPSWPSSPTNWYLAVL